MLISGAAMKIDKESVENDLKKMVHLYLSKGWSAKSVTDIATENFGRTYSKQTIYSIVNKVKDSL